MNGKPLIVIGIIALPTLAPIAALLLPTVIALILTVFFVILPFKANPPYAKSAKKKERSHRMLACFLLVMLSLLVNVWWTNWLVNLLTAAT